MVTIEESMSKIEGAYDHLATKADVAQLETKMGQIRSELVEKMGNLESRLTWRLLVGLFLQAGLVVALIKLLP